MKFLKPFTLVLIILLAGCGQNVDNGLTWQEQYDLGIRFLSEGNYEEAIIAFTAAIEIDPKQADAYIGLAEVYTVQGDTEKAAEVLADAIAIIGKTEELTAALEKYAPVEGQETEPTPEPSPAPEDEQETEPVPEPSPPPDEEQEAESTPEPSPEPTTEPVDETSPEPTETPEVTEPIEETPEPTMGTEGQPRTERQDNSDGSYYILTYNASEQVIRWIYYGADGSVILDYSASAGNYLASFNAGSAVIYVHENDAAGNEVREVRFSGTGAMERMDEYEYNASGQVIRWIYYGADGSVILDYSASAGNHLASFNAGSAVITVYENDAAGNLVREAHYNSDGSVREIIEY